MIEGLSFSTSYDLYKDVNKLSPINIRGNTTLFKTLKITVGGTLDPYTLDDDGNKTNTYELKENFRVGRLTAANFKTGFTFRPKGSKEKDSEDVLGDFDEYYVDF